jgi:hypothetical protein
MAEKVTLAAYGKRGTKASRSPNKNRTGEKPKKQAFTINHSQGCERGVPSRNSECDNDHRASDTLDHLKRTTSLAMTRRQMDAYNKQRYNRIWIPDVKERSR